MSYPTVRYLSWVLLAGNKKARHFVSDTLRLLMLAAAGVQAGSPDLNQSQLQCTIHRFFAAVDIELAVNIPFVGVQRGKLYMQLACNLFRIESGGQQPHDLQLPLCQRIN